MFSIPQYDVRVEDIFQGKLWDEDVFGQFSFWEWQKVIEQISSFRTRFQHHIHTDNQDWLVEGGAGGTERGIFSKEMSTPCPKPLQPKSSPEDGQNLAEVWAVSSFSSPWFLTTLSESQLQFNRDLLQARGKFYQYQEESNSSHTSWALLTVTVKWQWPSQEPGISTWFIILPWSNPVREMGRGLRSFPRLWPQKGWIWVEICDQNFLLRHFPGCFPWVLRCRLTCTGILPGQPKTKLAGTTQSSQSGNGCQSSSIWT